VLGEEVEVNVEDIPAIIRTKHEVKVSTELNWAGLLIFDFDEPDLQV